MEKYLLNSNGYCQGALLTSKSKNLTQKNEYERLNDVLFHISKKVNSSTSLKKLYDFIYQELNSIIYAKNFHIALRDKENDKINFTYFIDEKDKIDGKINQYGIAGILIDYNMRYGKTLLLNYAQIIELTQKGEIKSDSLEALTEETSWLGVPLKINNQIIGSMSVLNYNEPYIYSKKDIELMEFVSEQIVTALQKRIFEQRINQTDKRFVSLFRSNPLATIYHDTEGKILDINPRFTELFGHTREEILGKNIDEISLYSPEKNAEGKTLTKKVINTPLFRYETNRRTKNGTDIAVQITTSQVKIDNHIVGVIALYRDISEQKQNEKLQQALYNISRAANSLISLNQLYEIIYMGIKEIIDADNFYIALLNEKEDELFFVYYQDEKETDFLPENIKQGKTLTNFLIEHEQSLLLNCEQIKELVLEGRVEDPGTVTKEICWLGIPLKIEGRVIGVMAIQNYHNRASYSEKDLKLMEIVADQIATAIVRKQSEEKIIYMSFHDILTGLYNRAYFEEELKRMNHPRYYPLSVIMVDVNGLKAINDAFGHLQGDELLKNLAKILKKNSREVDVVARLGGDEFAILLPHASKRDAEVFCQRLNDSCQQNNFKPTYLNPNISIGFATQDGTFASCDSIIKEADNKMYQNKIFNAQSREKHLLNAFLTILAERDVHTANHAQHLTKISSMMGQKIGLNSYDLNRLRLLALLHDIGKIGVPETILFKEEPLTGEEWKKLKKHCQIGYRITKNIPDFSSIAKEILYHHERWDGKGYPLGLKEEEIPLLSRIIAIVDAYDAMQSKRNYKKALSTEEAREEIKKNAESQFDPNLVNVFLEIVKPK